jgi:NAD(P)H-hydrate epimerase
MMEERILDHKQVLELLPDRDLNAHKGDFGKILLLCGSRGYTGAAALAAMGCLRSGAGLVYLAVPECIYEITAIKVTEAIVLPLPSKGDTYAVDSVDMLRSLLPRMDAVLIGPGMGQSEGTMAVLNEVLTYFKGPVVVDADGLNLLAKHKILLRGRAAPTVLTPHEGEFVRLFPEFNGKRLQCAVSFAQDFNCVLVLKGHETLVTDSNICYRNLTGNPGMAVGGSGDILAGIIVSLLGQGIDLLQATAMGVWLHGAAGDLSAERLGQYGMLPTDLLDDLPRLMK